MAVNLEAIKAKLAAMQQRGGAGGNSSRVQLWKPGLGTHEIRGLPWSDEKLKDGTPFIEREFYYIGDNPGILAPAQFGKTDPIDNLRRELFKTGKPSDKELAKKLFARTRFYMPVIDRADPESGVMVWSFGKLVYQRLLGFFLDDEIGDYLDVEEGFDMKVVISKQAGKRFNDTSVDPKRKSTPLMATPEDIKKLMDARPDIDDMWRLKEATEIESILNSWLGGEVDVGEEGTSRGKPAADELDKLAEDVQGSTKEEKVEEPEAAAPVEEEKVKKEKAPAKKKAAKAKKAPDLESDPTTAPDLEDDAPKTQTLDEAFDELMEGEDEDKG